MREARENTSPAIINIEGNACAADVFVIPSRIDRRFAYVVASLECLLKTRFADSESRFLAMKKFSCSPASRRIGARQNRFFARIAATDSRARFWLARCIADRDRRSLRVKRRRIGSCRRHILAALRCRVWISEDRSRLADWPCRPMTSSPGRRTSRSTAAWR